MSETKLTPLFTEIVLPRPPTGPLLIIAPLVREYVEGLAPQNRIGPQVVFAVWLEWLAQREEEAGR